MRDSPLREAFDPEKHRKLWTTDTFVVEDGIKVPLRYCVPLRLAYWDGRPLLVGDAREGGHYRQQVEVPMFDKDGKPILDEETKEQRTAPEWQEITVQFDGGDGLMRMASLPHPVMGFLKVLIFPRMIGDQYEAEVRPDGVAAVGQKGVEAPATLS